MLTLHDFDFFPQWHPKSFGWCVGQKLPGMFIAWDIWYTVFWLSLIFLKRKQCVSSTTKKALELSPTCLRTQHCLAFSWAGDPYVITSSSEKLERRIITDRKKMEVTIPEELPVPQKIKQLFLRKVTSIYTGMICELQVLILDHKN